MWEVRARTVVDIETPEAIPFVDTGRHMKINK